METLAELAEILVPLTKTSVSLLMERGPEGVNPPRLAAGLAGWRANSPSLDGYGYPLTSCEAIDGDFVEADPWFAGYFAVASNLSNIAAAGGRATVISKLTWRSADELPAGVWDGVQAAAYAYGISGQCEIAAGSDGLKVSILGRAGERLTRSNTACSGDLLIMVIDLKGAYREDRNIWDSSTSTLPQRLRSNLELIPTLAEKGLCRAGTRIGKGGLITSVLSLSECSKRGVLLDLEQIPCPADSAIARWLLTEQTYGYLFAVAPEDLENTLMHFTSSRVSCRQIGYFRDSAGITLIADGEHVDLISCKPGIHSARDVFHSAEAVL